MFWPLPIEPLNKAEELSLCEAALLAACSEHVALVPSALVHTDQFDSAALSKQFTYRQLPYWEEDGEAPFVLIQESFSDGEKGTLYIDPDFKTPWLIREQQTGKTFFDLSEAPESDLAELYKKAPKTHRLAIEWAYTDQLVLLSIQKVEHTPLRNTLFAPLESLPTSCSLWFSDLVLSCEDHLLEFFERFDIQVPQERYLLERQEGQIVWNLSLLEDLSHELGISPSDLHPKLKDLPSKGKSKLPLHFSFTFPRRVRAWLNQNLENFVLPRKSLSGFIRQLQSIYTFYLQGELGLNLAQAPFLAPLLKNNLLSGHQTLYSGRSYRFFKALEPLRERAQQALILNPELEASKLLEVPGFAKEWQLFLSEYAHRGPLESDISQERILETPETLFRLLLQPWRVELEHPEKDWRLKLSTPLWKQLEKYITLREELYSDTLWSLHQVRRQMEPLLEEWVNKKQLPDSQSFWKLTLEQSLELEKGASFSTLFFEMQTHQQKRPLPGRFYRFTPEQHEQKDIQGILGEYKEGNAWVLTQPTSDTLPSGFKPWSTILVCPNIDLGWMSVLPRIGGVILTQASAKGEAARLLRELNIPSLIYPEALSQIQTGDALKLYPSENQLEQL